VPTKVPTIEELGLPPAIAKIAELRSGLVLVAGPAGSGKTTTVAAIVDQINRTQKRHIIAIEDPIEYVHTDAKSAVSHRQVGTHTESAVTALRAARWQDADVIVLGEMMEPEVISLALTAASTGTLVIGTLPTNSAAKAMDRIIDAFPPAEQNQVRGTLAECLRAVVAQQLVKRKEGQGPRVPVTEVLLGSGALTMMIRERKTDGIVNLMQSGRAQGMQTMDDALERCVKDGRIAAEEAYMRALDKHRFEHYVVAAQSAAQVAARAGGAQQH
jgi:twitching motility protein PilT